MSASFKQFLLNENKSFSFEDGLHHIGAECKLFLSKANVPLYRGINFPGIGNKIFFTDHPQDRTPKDSDPVFNFLFNAMIDGSHGYTDVRRKSFFATGSSKNARMYGELYFIFPKGKFQFLWSDKINDSYEDEDVIRDSVVDQLKHHEITNNHLKIIFNILAKEIKNPSSWIHNSNGDAEEITQEALKRILKPGLYTNQYSPYWDDKNFYKILTGALINTGANLYDSKQLRSAIKSLKEILITESNGYYAVPIARVQIEMAAATGLPAGHLNYDAIYKWLLTQLR